MISFTATTVSGSKRGKKLGTPTINLDLAQVPPELNEGIYACIAIINDERLPAVMHYGPRPVFKDTPSCEVHILDRKNMESVERIRIDIVSHLRPVADFPSVEALMAQIQKDIDQARAMLEQHD